MSFKRLRLHIRNEEGSGLVLALMTLLVLSVLGASLGAVTVGSFKLGDVNRDDTSAYYIAEAGANIAYEEMKAGVLEAYSKYDDAKGLFYQEIEDNNNGLIKSIEENTYEFEDQFGDTPTVSINFSDPEGSNPRKYTIISTGVVAGKTRTVEKQIEVSWVKKDSGQSLYIPENAALIGNDSLNLVGRKIVGDIHIISKNKNAVQTDWVDLSDSEILVDKSLSSQEVEELIYYHSYKSMPKWSYRDKNIDWGTYEDLANNFPEIDVNDYPELSEKELNKKTIHLDSDYRSDKIDLSGESKKLNPQGNDVWLVLDELTMNRSSLEVIGNGTVNIYVKNKLSFEGGGIELISKTKPSQLNIYYAGQEDISLMNNNYFFFNLFAKSSDINFGSAFFDGVILSGSENVIDYANHSQSDLLLIAPKAHVKIVGSGRINGSVIAKTSEVNNSGFITYKYYNFDNFPFGSFEESEGTGGEVSSAELISTEPAIEPN